MFLYGLYSKYCLTMSENPCFTINRIALEVYEVKNKSCENYP